MKFAILNSAMIPNEGIFSYQNLTLEQARTWLDAHAQSAASFVGYPQTADHITTLAGIPGWRCRLSRDKVTLAPGDEVFVCKLAFRVDAGSKGRTQAGDWEYGLLRRIAP